MPLKKIRGAIAGAAFVCLSAALSFGVYAQSVHLDPLHVQAYTQPGDTPEEFVPTKRMAAAVIPAAQVNLGAWVAEKAAVPLGGALQVGAQRMSSTTATPQALGEMLPWQRSANGGWVAAVSVTSENAYGLRLGVVVDQLPGSALLRVYTQRNRDAVFEIAGQRVLQILQANAAAGDVSSEGRTWWTPDSGGDEVTLEIELPPGTSTDTLRLSIPQVMHVYENLSLPLEDEQAITAKINESGYCNLDATCYDNYSTQRNAAARMLFVKDGYGYLCTGTLLNDRNSTATPYFITANHCISSQTVASTLQTSWFYRSPSCDARTLSASYRVLRNGATLLYTSDNPDSTLLRLNDTPPAGAVFAGWDAGTRSAGQSVVGVHHPRGDLQKISFGAVRGLNNCIPADAGSYLCGASSSGYYYNVGWSQGTTEPGSSGSGLFFDGRLTGTLSNGSATCSTTAGSDNYARFDIVYPALKQWLEAGSAGTPGGGTGGSRTAVYRFYNVQTGAHFYTNSAAERDYVIATLPAFQYENVAFYAYPAQQAGLSAVYRFYNTGTGAHFYTISTAERDYVNVTLPAFQYEGPTWYAQSAAGGSAMPVYRFYNSQTGAHFYTVSAAERDFVISTLPAFMYENVAYYVWTSQ